MTSQRLQPVGLVEPRPRVLAQRLEQSQSSQYSLNQFDVQYKLHEIAEAEYQRGYEQGRSEFIQSLKAKPKAIAAAVDRVL